VASLAVVTSSPPYAEGGHLVIARSLVAAARESGHDARLVITPDAPFGRIGASYLATWRTDLSRVEDVAIDQVITLRFPSYAVRHHVHVCWLNHTMREYYDLWPRFVASVPRRTIPKEIARRTLLHAADGLLLRFNVTKILAQSQTIQRRLAADLGIKAGVLWPPAPQRAYRCDRYGDFILAVSRLTTLKRIDLLLRALAEPVARGVKAVIVGDGEERDALQRHASDLGIADRVQFLGRVDDDEILAQLARCRAVCFTPLSEDYGFVTVEAFASRKAVITCSDSGGPTELVRDHETGLICEPTPASIAIALARMTDDAAFAERLGTRAGEQAATMTWDDAVKQLVIV
jgi:glycosyltransferase involved in cell wall biosynthesis